MSNKQPHNPVLLAKVLDALAPLKGRDIVDGTFGAGGYSLGFLQAGARVIAIDRDPNSIRFANQLSKEWGEKFCFVLGQFSHLDEFVNEQVDAIVLDIGVSSMQLDEGMRGFSFMRDGPLDMRMSGEGASAADLVNNLSEKQLSDILFAYGEEKRAKRIANAIILARNENPIKTTLELANLIEKTVGKTGKIHPATKSFQALRIAVNSEFDELVAGLFAAENLLKEGAILLVVSFHSLEDRIVKRFFASGSGSVSGSRHSPQIEQTAAVWQEIAKPIKANRGEIESNPRSRSATLRFAIRSASKARTPSVAGLGVPLSKGKNYA